eukprot:351617-Chlamydomonas_euryale.AAC.3
MPTLPGHPTPFTPSAPPHLCVRHHLLHRMCHRHHRPCREAELDQGACYAPLVGVERVKCGRHTHAAGQQNRGAEVASGDAVAVQMQRCGRCG